MSFAIKIPTLFEIAAKSKSAGTGKAKSSLKSKKAPAAKDAIALLKADHVKVSELFDEYEKTSSAKKKKTIVAEICTELTVHTQIEEEIFYPAVKLALKDKDLVPEATVEHATVKELIAQVEGIEPDGEMYDAKIKVLSEYIKHHVKEEQNEMFPKAKSTSLDMVELGEQMEARKSDLLAARS
jgi:hemerythrin-like domain-containing protein